MAGRIEREWIMVALSSPYRNGDNTTTGLPTADVEPVKHDGSSTCRLAIVPCAIGASSEGGPMRDRSFVREPTVAAEQEDSEEFEDSPPVPKLGRGLSRIRRA
jgi:hypothetical protein